MEAIVIHLATRTAWQDPLALATFLLAVGTGSLAWFSRKDVAAQERPVVLVDERRVGLPMPGGAGSQRQLVLYVSSAGRGPALNLEGRVVAPKDLHVTAEPPVQSLPVGGDFREFARDLRWSFLDPDPVPVKWTVILSYSDLSDRKFETVVDFKVNAQYNAASPRQRVRRIRH